MSSQHKKYLLVKQKGVVLFVALIALVVMSLAAVALIRSVDTSTLIAGNLASKQSATASGDSGMETAITWLSSITNGGTLQVDAPGSGYYATQTADPMNLSWDNTDSLPANDASGAQLTANGQDLSGNTTRYIIQRMCRATGAPTSSNCLFGPPVDDLCSKRGGAESCPPLEPPPMYRITARVVGIKNTVSFVQAYLY